jgi:hypothetical protein
LTKALELNGDHTRAGGHEEERGKVIGSIAMELIERALEGGRGNGIDMIRASDDDIVSIARSDVHILVAERIDRRFSHSRGSYGRDASSESIEVGLKNILRGATTE